MYLFQLIFWFITYSVLIASTAISIGMVPSGIRRSYRACIMTNISILLIVISVSLVFLFNSLTGLDAEAWGSFFLQLLFYSGISAVSWFACRIPDVFLPDAGTKRGLRLFSVSVLLFFTAHLISSLVIMSAEQELHILSLITGVFQLGILLLFFLSLAGAAVRLAAGWKSGKPATRVFLSIAFIMLILAVFGIDVAYGVWSKIHDHRDLSLFYVFPAFLTVISIFLTGITVFTAGRRAAAGSSAIETLKSFGLSLRETEVASLISEGRSYQETADALFISLATVQSHIKSIYRKTGVNSKTELANLCSNGGPASV